MNRKFIRQALGKLLQVLSGLMVLPFIVSLIYKESRADKLNFLIPLVCCYILGTIMVKLGDASGKFFMKEAMFITATCWVLYSAIGAIPLYLTESNYPRYLDALFEMASGFTTTGASVASNVELLPHSIIFWRSFSHFIGGMGILVFTLAILPKNNKSSTLMMQAEVPGPTFGKITAKVADTARVLYIIYGVMTAITVVFLYIGHMNFFDSLIYAFGAAGTGGFSNRGNCLAYYDSRYLEVVLGIAMLLFGVNFNIYYYSLTRGFREGTKSEEFKWYLIIIFVTSGLIFLNIYNMYDSKGYSLSNAFFTVSSIITTTGYVSADYGQRPFFSRNLLILLMFIGGCAGSTAGGLKVSRVVILFKRAINQIHESLNPKRVTVNRLDGKKIDDETETSVGRYFVVYMLIFVILMVIVSIDTNDLETAFSSVATTFNNVGPGLGKFGPITSFAEMSYLSKFALTIAMWLGRLELFPILLLFSPSTYKNMKNSTEA